MPAGVGGAVPATGLCWLATIPENVHKQTTEVHTVADTIYCHQIVSCRRVAVTKLPPLNKLNQIK